MVRCDGRIAIYADTATPIYRYIEFKGQFQVRTGDEIADIPIYRVIKGKTVVKKL